MQPRHERPFSVNQRAFAGGALAAGVYGLDRWKAGPGGAVLGVTGGVATLTGALRQVIEAPGLAGIAVIVSVKAQTADIAATVGDGAGLTASGVIPAGSGRRGVALTVPSGVTGHLTLDLAAALSTAFSRVQLEAGRVATAFERRPLALELELFRRNFEQNGPGPGTHNPVVVAGGLTSTIVSGIVPFAEKPATPSVNITGAYDILGVAAAASVNSLSTFTITRKAFEMRAVLSGAVPLLACGIFPAANDTAATITISAEL